MSKHSTPCQPSCDCRGCECPNCPIVLTSTQEFGSSSYVCDHGTRPKCTCSTAPRVRTAKSNPDCRLKPQPIPLPDCCLKPQPIPLPDCCLKSQPIPLPDSHLKPQPIPLPDWCLKPQPIPLPDSRLKPEPIPLPDCCLEPEPIPDPERTESIMKLLKCDKDCFCKVVTRALRADVHRYLGLLDVDRHICSNDTQTCCRDA